MLRIFFLLIDIHYIFFFCEFKFLLFILEKVLLFFKLKFGNSMQVLKKEISRRT